MSSGILIDRIKDLEMMKDITMDDLEGERPETANVLSKICKYKRKKEVAGYCCGLMTNVGLVMMCRS